MNVAAKIIKTEILSDNWYTLRKITYEFLKKDGTVQTQSREAYDRGNGATILLYNKARKTVILTRQFRLPSFVNGNESGMLIEACAGLLDKDNAEDCIKRETEEETGYKNSMKVTEGGGIEHEQEDIEVLELDFDKAFQMIETGEIKDGKTIMLLQYAKLNNLV